MIFSIGLLLSGGLLLLGITREVQKLMLLLGSHYFREGGLLSELLMVIL